MVDIGKIKTANGFWFKVLLTLTDSEMKKILKCCLPCPEWGCSIL